MTEIQIDPDLIVHRKFMGPAELLKPTLFWDGKNYTCLLGPDGVAGLMASSSTPVMALRAWNRALIMRLQSTDDNDYVYLCVKDVLEKASNDLRAQALSQEIGLIQWA
jgi:hypothetical protein